MQSNKKLEEIKKALPLGAQKEIAERLGIHAKTVENVFEGKNCLLKHKLNVVKEAEKLLEEYKEVMGVDLLKNAQNEKV